MKDQIIEFPISPSEMFEGAIDQNNGYCISYQYDMDENGYGPYGFRTERVIKLLREILCPALRWDASRKRLVEMSFPLSAGVYFFENQLYVEELEVALRDYERFCKLLSLKLKYKKSQQVEIGPVEPSIFMVSSERKMSAALVNELLRNKCRFFIVYSMMPYTGQTLVFFNERQGKSLKELAVRESVSYVAIASIDDVRPW